MLQDEVFKVMNPIQTFPSRAASGKEARPHDQGPGQRGHQRPDGPSRGEHFARTDAQLPAPWLAGFEHQLGGLDRLTSHGFGVQKNDDFGTFLPFHKNFNFLIAPFQAPTQLLWQRQPQHVPPVAQHRS